MNYSILLSCFFLLFFGCQSKKSNQFINSSGVLIYEEYYGNGQLRTVKQFFNDEKSDYTLITYYEDGHIMDSLTYRNSLAQGRRVFYDQPGDLMHIEHFEEGVLNGLNMGIYGNGVRSYEGYRKNGDKVGEWNFRNPDGINITYEFYDSTGRLIYFRKYDERGNYQKSNGEVLIQVSFDKETFELGDSVYAYVVAVIPPECESKLTATIRKGQIDEKIIHSEILTSPRYNFGFNVGEPDDYTVLFQVDVSDSFSGKVEMSKVERNFTVKEN